jgi:hypothetical protein
MESPENQRQVFRPSHRSWKSLRDFHISTFPAITTYICRAENTYIPNQQLRVGQNKMPKWTRFTCQTQTQLRSIAEPQNRIAAEVKLLRQCSHWLKQLENGEEVIVNLRPDADTETEYVRFDRLRIIRILERIAADLDRLAEGTSTQFEGDPHSERRRRLAEEPKPKRRLSTREERNALRAELKLPPT